MKKGLKIWEWALLAGLLVGLLGSPADAAQPLSRWQTGEVQVRYQVRLFPFGIAEGAQTVSVETVGTREESYELGFKVLEWWEALFGQRPVCSHSSARE